MNSGEFETKLNDYYMERVGKGDALLTAERRVRRIRWLSKRIDVFKPDMRKVYEYIESRERNGIKKKTLRIEMMDLEHWFSFIGLATRMPRLKKEPSPDPFVPTPEQLEKILGFCDVHHNREVWFRNRLVIELFSFTGARVGELVKVNLDDIKDGFLYIRSEKGEKDRHVPLPEGLQDHVRTYVGKYRMQSDQRALLTTDQGRMPYEYIRSMIKKIGVKVGMPELHAHSFRHFYGTYMYRTTNDLRLVQILLGHARIETTTIYEHLSTKEFAEKGRPYVEKLFREGSKMMGWVHIPAGVVQNKWAHWDLNPDLRVSSRFIVPVTHHKIS
jgi:site-specific recombinase XerD